MLMNPVQMFTRSVQMFREGYWILWILGITRGGIVTGSLVHEGIFNMGILSISLCLEDTWQ
jgi:hypothetical protein